MATLPPWINTKFYLADGITPNAGGKVFTYAPGTSTKKTTYVSESGAANTNPIILGSNGECNMWFGAGGYKVVNAPSTDTDPPAAAIKTWDDINTSSSVGLEYGIVESIADLKALNEGAFETVQVLGYYSANGIGSGVYYWDATSTASNNGGTVIAPTVTDGTGRWILIQNEPIKISQFGARGVTATEDTPAIIAAYGSFAGADGKLIIDADVILNSNVTIPSNVSIEAIKGATFSGAYTLAINGQFECGLFQCFASTVTVAFGSGSVESVNPEWWGALADNSTECYSAIVAAYTAFPRVKFSKGTYRYNTTFAMTATQNGVYFSGVDIFDTILRYTGSSDGLTMQGNLNGFTWSDMRLYSTTGRDAISITAGSASATPDAGILNFSRLDIRGWLRHGIKARLTVDVRTDHLQLVLNGGCGIYVENANPYRSTTWTDTGSWMHENGGHGIALKGTFTYTFSGTISDSNTGVSTDVDTISCAGYTLIGGGVWVNCVAADIGKSVTQGGVTVGTLAHYSNTNQHMVINCTTAPSGVGALAITTGTGSSTTSTFRKNSHGLYAARSAYINIQGGHYENHLYGIFLDSVYDAIINPGYILTQGTGAYGSYFAGTCIRIDAFIAGCDVQSGGIAAAYRGPLTKGVNWSIPGAYTTQDESLDGITIDTQNAASTIVTLKSTGSNPFNSTTTSAEVGYFSGSENSEALFSVNSSGGAASRATYLWRKDGTILARAFADNNLNSFVTKISANAYAITNGTLEDVVQSNTANNFYIPIQGVAGPVIVETSNGGSEGAVALGRLDGVARLNNGEVRAVVIELNAIGSTANERGGRIILHTRTGGASGVLVARATLDEAGATLASLAGTGSRLVQADTNGLLSASIGILAASGTWDPGNMAADGDAVSTTITVTGAAVGNQVSASLTTIGANNVLISAHVQAADTVRVILMNKTGGAIDIASGTLAVKVWV